MFGADTGLNELSGDMHGVLHAGCKANRLSPLTEFVPMRDDVADQIIAIHALGKLGFNIITGYRLDAL